VKRRRLMDMTSREVDALGERDHERQLARYEREQDMAQDRDGPDPSDRDPGTEPTWADLEVLADCLEDEAA
jgi:hypothetical protein